ncbi:MAG: hypothetical protein AAFR51_12225 [Pseudomonadota bacterium]
MTFRKLLLAGAATSVAVATFAAPTQAGIIDRPHFKVEPIIIVWAAGADDTGGVVTEFIVGADKPGTDLIAEDGQAVNTGTLTPTDDALGTLNSLIDVTNNVASDLDLVGASAGSLNAFSATETLTGSTPSWESSFYVATNTAFSIDATATETFNDGDFTLADISFSLSNDATSGTVGSISWGAQNQSPNGAFPEVAHLGELGGVGTPVYDGSGDGQRTAGGSGSIADQSVRFDAVYTFTPNGYDLSMGAGEIQADVTYTFYAA